MGRTLYLIRDWDDTFEVSQNKKVKAWSWVPMPIKHDGKSFRRLMLREDAGDVFAAWILIVQVAAKCPTRGVLADNDGPLDASDLNIKTGFSATKFSNALKVLSSKEIGWLSTDLLLAPSEHGPSALGIEEREELEDLLCGEDATGTAGANGSPNGSGDGAQHCEDAPEASQATPDASGKANGQSYPESFEAFWLAYPMRGGRKRGKSKCYGIWRQAIRVADRQPLVEAAQAYAASDEAARGFARDGERFLRNEWWRDWIPSLAGQPPPAPPPEVPHRVTPHKIVT